LIIVTTPAAKRSLRGVDVGGDPSEQSADGICGRNNSLASAAGAQKFQARMSYMVLLADALHDANLDVLGEGSRKIKNQ